MGGFGEGGRRKKGYESILLNTYVLNLDNVVLVLCTYVYEMIMPC